MRCNHLSASSISAFKACSMRYRLGYVEGLRPIEDTDSQRQGSNWHALFEAYGNADGDHDAKMTAAVEHLNQRYTLIPKSKTIEEWAIERQILLVSFHGYWWYWQADPLEILASEVAFELPIHNPTLGLPLPLSEAARVGRIDNIIKWQGAVCALERKSTSRSIAPDSDYWTAWQKNSQVSMYAMAFRDMVASGTLPQSVLIPEHGHFGGTLVDIWHKPTISLKVLTQAATAEFIESGDYCGQKFEVKRDVTQLTIIEVNGVGVEIEQGKKGFAIRETIEMYGARLLADIYERPEFYFARREISRTDADIQHFRKQLWAVYQAQRAFIKGGHWFENESQCQATFRCQYMPICYGPGADAVCDGKTTPEGFKRTFVDLTVNGQEVEE